MTNKRRRALVPLAVRLARSRAASERALERKCPTCGKLMAAYRGNRGAYHCTHCYFS
jgi:ribosomal protein S27AE